MKARGRSPAVLLAAALIVGLPSLLLSADEEIVIEDETAAPAVAPTSQKAAAKETAGAPQKTTAPAAKDAAVIEGGPNPETPAEPAKATETLEPEATEAPADEDSANAAPAAAEAGIEASPPEGDSGAAATEEGVDEAVTLDESADAEAASQPAPKDEPEKVQAAKQEVAPVEKAAAVPAPNMAAPKEAAPQKAAAEAESAEEPEMTIDEAGEASAAAGEQPEIETADGAPADTNASAAAGKEAEVRVDEPAEAAEPLPAPVASLPDLKLPAPSNEPPPSFKLAGKNRGFNDFLACGVPVSSAATCRVSSVTGSPDMDRFLSFRGTQVMLAGKLKRDQVLAAYRLDQGGCLARYVGLVVVTGEGARTPGGTPVSRGYIASSREPIIAGDGLCPVESVQKEFERQYSSPPRPGNGPLNATIICIANGLSYIDTRQRMVMVDRGRKDGVSPGWSCEFQAPDSGNRTTYGRVVRADETTCFVQFLRLCEPVESGRQVLLSGARTKTAATAKRR